VLWLVFSVVPRLFLGAASRFKSLFPGLAAYPALGSGTRGRTTHAELVMQQNFQGTQHFGWTGLRDRSHAVIT
jgi:hypothetical protein